MAGVGGATGPKLEERNKNARFIHFFTHNGKGGAGMKEEHVTACYIPLHATGKPRKKKGTSRILHKQ